MCKLTRLLIAIAFLGLIVVPAASAATVLLPCGAGIVNSQSDFLTTCPGVTGQLPGTTVTAVKLYLIADFSGAQEGISNKILVQFTPSPIISNWHPASQLCTLANAAGSMMAVTNTCGFYSGDPNAPGTSYITADNTLQTLGKTPFTVQITRASLEGTVEFVTASPIVAYTVVPEPSVPLLLTSSLLVVGLVKRRKGKTRR